MKIRYFLIIFSIAICDNSFSQIITIDTIKNRAEYFECVNQAFVAMKYIEKNDYKNVKILLINSSNRSIFTDNYLKKKVEWGYELIKRYGLPNSDKIIVLSIKTIIQGTDNNSFIYNEDVSITFSFPVHANESPDKISVTYRKKGNSFILEGLLFVNRNELKNIQDLINNAAVPKD